MHEKFLVAEQRAAQADLLQGCMGASAMGSVRSEVGLLRLCVVSTGQAWATSFSTGWDGAVTSHYNPEHHPDIAEKKALPSLSWEPLHSDSQVLKKQLPYC